MLDSFYLGCGRREYTLAGVLIAVAFSLTTISGIGAVDPISSDEFSAIGQITGFATQSDVETTETDTIDLQRGLKAYYRFDNPKVSRGYSLEFDGQDDYIDASGNFSDVIAYNSSFTVSAWVRPDDVGSQFASIVGQRYGSSMVFGLDNGSIDSAGKLFLNMDDTRDASPTSSGTLSEGRWQHVVVTYSGGTSRDATFYIDGDTSGGGDADDGNGIGQMDSMYIGHQKRNDIGFPNDYFRGDIDNVRIYNRSLSAVEIQKMYESKFISAEGLVRSYNFNSGPKCDLLMNTGCIRDESPNGNSGVPFGFEDNNFDTDSGWLNETPINRPSAKDYSEKNHAVRFYGGKNGKLKNFNFDKSSGWKKGKIGENALKFDGRDDFVSLNNLSTDEVTVSIWAKQINTGGDTDKLLVSTDDETHPDSGGFSLNYGRGTDLYFRVETTDTGWAAVDDGATLGSWHHIVGMYDGDAISLYVDGSRVARDTSVSGSLAKPSFPLKIGGASFGSNYPFNGSIDGVRIYNRGLSDSEIKSLYEGQSVTKGLVGRWNFESGDRETTYDTSSLRKVGILGSNSVEMMSGGSFTSSDQESLSSENQVAVSAWYSNPRYKFGDGSDGSVTVTGGKRIDEDLKSNGRTYPDAVNYVAKRLGGSEISTFSTPDGIREGDQVLVINLQGTTSKYGNVGEYSFRRVESVNYSFNEIILENEVSGEFGDATYQNIVVQRVPEYTDLTVDSGELTVSDWERTSIESCPEGWTYHAGECYIQTSSDTWSNTRSLCRDYGGELARIDNSSVNSFVTDNYPDSWIGFRDISGSNDGGADGEYEWVWTFGAYYDYKNFASGEPSIGGVNNNPTTRIGSGGGWYTEYGDNNTYPGVCELNKKKGGVLAFEASGELSTVNGGIINTTGKGYRGGDCSFCGDDSDGRAGEGVAGSGKYGFYGEVNNVNGGAGAGVNNNDGGDPAGGGGYGTAGGTSDRGHEGGVAIGSHELAHIYFGGGGGAGSDNDGGRPYSEDSHGGGIVYLSAETVENTRIKNKGVESFAGDGCNGVSGGGAGGTVYLKTVSAGLNLINASGGPRDFSGSCGVEYSGKGGEGRIRINTVESDTGVVDPESYYTGLIPNLVREEGEFGLGGYRDVVYGNINNRSAAFNRVSESVEWRNLALTFGSGSAELYLNGEKVDSFQKSSLTRLDNNLILSGGVGGRVDEVRVYNRSISGKEAARLAFR